MNNAEKRYLTKIDEINQLFYDVADSYPDTDTLNQAVYDFLLDMFLEGFAVTGFMLNDKERSADISRFNNLVYTPIDGKTLFDRIDTYYDIAKMENSIGITDGEELILALTTAGIITSADEIPEISPQNAILRVLETEGHRIYNEGGFARAGDCGAKYKQWQTMADDKVRDTHSYLSGVKIPIDEKFYTYDGDSALLPSGFELAENNVNCRCWVSYSF